MTPVFEYVRDLTARLIGNTLEPDRSYLLEGRLAGLAARERAGSVDALVTRLQASPLGTLHWEAVEAVTNKETLFFRDEALFSVLHEEVLPALVAARQATRCLRIWCAACSSGQEPYSLAMLLNEGWLQLRTWDIEILASDIASEALQRASAGFYTEFEVTRGLTEERLLRHFERGAEGWTVRRTVRDLVRFERINLTGPWPAAAPFDLVLLRNVMLYFDTDVRRAVLQRVHTALAPDGYLFMGAAENLLPDEDLYGAVVSGRTLGFRPVGRGGGC